MTELITSLPLFVQVITVMGGIGTVSLLMLTLVRRTIPIEHLEAHNDVAGFVYAVLGATYAVVLAFVAIAVWEEFKAADSTVSSEAEALLRLYRASAAYPEPAREEIRTAAIEYGRTVSTHGWESLRRGQDNPHALAALDRLWQSHLALVATSDRDSVWLQQSLDALNRVTTQREERLFQSRNTLPDAVWVVVTIGGFLTIGYVCLYGVRNPWGHAAITTGMSAMLAVIIVEIIALDHPFVGPTSVSPDALISVTEVMESMRELPVAIIPTVAR